MLDVGGLSAIKQGIAFSKAVISSYLEGITGAPFYLLVPSGVAVGTSFSAGQVSSKRGLTTNSK